MVKKGGAKKLGHLFYKLARLIITKIISIIHK